MFTKYVWFSLDGFSKWPCQVSEMETTCPNFCHDPSWCGGAFKLCWNPPGSKSTCSWMYYYLHMQESNHSHLHHSSQVVTHFISKQGIWIPRLIELGWTHMFHTLERTLIMVYHKWMHFSSCPLKLSQFTSKNIWITDPLGKQGRSSLTAAQSTQVESRRQTTVQVLPHRTLQKQSINPAMVCCKRHTLAAGPDLETQLCLPKTTF